MLCDHTDQRSDEIGIDGNLNDTSFQRWCREQKVALTDLGCSSWSACPFATSLANASTNARLYYWSIKADHEAGIDKVKATVDRLRPLLPHAKLGANWAPGARYKDVAGKARAHHYIGWTFQWINLFRRGALSVSPAPNEFGESLF